MIKINIPTWVTTGIVGFILYIIFELLGEAIIELIKSLIPRPIKEFCSKYHRRIIYGGLGILTVMVFIYVAISIKK